MQMHPLDFCVVQRPESSQPDVECDARHVRSDSSALIKNSGCEVQSGSGCRNRAAFPREHCLITIAILTSIRATDIGRQRHVADAIENSYNSPFGRKRTVRSPNSPRPRISIDNSSDTVTSSPVRILRPGRTSASHVSRSADICLVRNTSTRPPVPCSRWPYNRDGNTRESLSTRQSPE